MTREIKIVEIPQGCGSRKHRLRATIYRGWEFLEITENEGERFQLKFCTRTQYRGGGGIEIVIMKVIVSWRRGRNCWRSTFDVATDQLRSLKSWRSLNRHRCLVNLQPHVFVANYPISAQYPPHRLHLIPPTHDEFSMIHYTVRGNRFLSDSG